MTATKRKARPATACGVCGIRTLRTREPLASSCAACSKPLCSAHTHFYVDGNSSAITRSARPMCATCTGLTAIPCAFDRCRHVTEARDPHAGAQLIQQHYDRQHPRLP